MSLPIEVLETLYNRVTEEVSAGFEDKEGIIVTTLEYIGGHCDFHHIPCDDDELEQTVIATVEDVLTQHYEEQNSWAYPTDCDRLDEAFEALNEIGIVARQNFSCCQNCGTTEIWAEVEQLSDAVGYAFYHFQDTEYVVQGHGLYLSYGSVERTPAASRAIGQRIVATLRLVGLPCDWNGRLSQRIYIPMNWQRRRS
jgi:hypothetical protein